MPTFHDQLKKAYFENLQADISSGSTGRFWLRTDTTPVSVRFWNGTAVKEVVTTDDAQAITAKTRLELVKGSANIATGYGLIRMATVSTDNTAKEGAISSGHYDSDDEDMCAIYTNNASGIGDVYVGGGVDKLNAAKKIRFFAASDTTTVTGTEVAQALVGGFRFILATTYVGLGSTPGNPDSGEFKLYMKTDGYAYILDSNGTERKIGTGSDSGVNYILNPDAETATTGWSAYADAAATSPVDGTGGSPTFAISRNTSSPLRGSGQFRLTKDAVNRQGEGVSYAFTIDSADKAKMLTIAFDYAVSSAFVSGSSSDVTVWIYDVTNSQLIQPAGYTIEGGTGVNHRQLCTFQSNSNSTSYRLILHVATTNASAWTMDIDRVSVGPQDKVYGTAVTDWKSFTPTGSWSTNTTYTGFWRRVGDQMEVKYLLSLAGAPTSANLTVNLPSGYVIDTTKVLETASNIVEFGDGVIFDSGTGQASLSAKYSSSTALAITYLDVTSVGASNTFSNVTQAAPMTFANGDYVFVHVRVPIAGWSSSVEVSSAAETRLVAARYSTNTANAIADSTDVIVDFEDLSKDTHAAVTTGASWKFTAPVPGMYSVKAGIQLASATGWAEGEILTIFLYKNGSKVSRLGRTIVQATPAGSIPVSVVGADDIYLNAGDYIDVRARHNNGASINLNGTAEDNFVAISRHSGPSQIAASESVLARSTSSTGFSIPNNTETILGFDAVTYDTHSAVTTGASWKFTAPMSGKYFFNISCKINGTADWEEGEEAFLSLYKNGSRYNYMANYTHAKTGVRNVQLDGHDVISLNAGDYIQVYIFQNADASQTLASDAKQNWINIIRIGN